MRGQRARHQRADAARLGRAPPPGPCRASATSTPTAPTWPPSTTPRWPPRPGSGSGVPRRSCTWPWSGSAGTRARTWRPATAARPQIAADLDRRSAARHRPAAGQRRACSPRPRCCARYEAVAGPGAGAWPPRWPGPRGWPRPPQVMAPLAPRRPDAVAAGACLAAEPARGPGRGVRRAAARGRPGPLTLAQSINAALADALAARPGMLVFGEDVARKGGVYGVTRGLLARFGAGRVFDTLLDEQSILGLALGAGPGRAAAGAGDPVPGLPAQRGRPDPRRGRDAVLLLPGAVPQPDGACGSPGSPTSRGSAATSTTTTRWPRCATSPA